MANRLDYQYAIIFFSVFMKLTSQQKDVLCKQEKYLQTLLHLHVRCVELYEQCIEDVHQESGSVHHYVGLVQVSVRRNCAVVYTYWDIVSCLKLNIS